MPANVSLLSKSLISCCKTRKGSACPGNNGIATGMETSAGYVVIHTIEFKWFIKTLTKKTYFYT